MRLCCFKGDRSRPKRAIVPIGRGLGAPNSPKSLLPPPPRPSLRPRRADGWSLARAAGPGNRAAEHQASSPPVVPAQTCGFKRPFTLMHIFVPPRKKRQPVRPGPNPRNRPSQLARAAPPARAHRSRRRGARWRAPQVAADSRQQLREGRPRARDGRPRARDGPRARRPR